MTDAEKKNRIEWLRSRIKLMAEVPIAAEDVARMRAELERLEKELAKVRTLFDVD